MNVQFGAYREFRIDEASLGGFSRATQAITRSNFGREPICREDGIDSTCGVVSTGVPVPFSLQWGFTMQDGVGGIKKEATSSEDEAAC